MTFAAGNSHHHFLVEVVSKVERRQRIRIVAAHRGRQVEANGLLIEPGTLPNTPPLVVCSVRAIRTPTLPRH